MISRIDFLLSYVLGLKERSKKLIFTLAKRIPKVAKELDKEMKKIKEDFEKDVIKRTKGKPFITELPKNSFSADEIIKIVKENVSLGIFYFNLPFFVLLHSFKLL